MIESVIDLIGDTPLVSLKQTTGLSIYAKAEFLNPGGSIKDRVAKNMVACPGRCAEGLPRYHCNAREYE